MHAFMSLCPINAMWPTRLSSCHCDLDLRSEMDSLSSRWLLSGYVTRATVEIKTVPVLIQFLSLWWTRDRKQLREKRVPFSLHFQVTVHHWGVKARSLEAETEEETKDEHHLLACSPCLTSLIFKNITDNPVPRRQRQHWAGPSHIKH